MTTLSPAQRDRAAGVLVATAAGDALGAGYEFGPPLPTSTPVGMIGGGGFGWAPGEWTDDTSMATVIARCAAAGGDLRSDQVQDQIAQGWIDWARTAPDVGNQTRDVLSRAERDAGGRPATAAQLREEARAHHHRAGRSGGNGSLMRTAPVALAYLHDEDALVEAAT
ncbi:MAG: ADP-ribosylglycohydrolase family protein, partial [Mycobacteriaceae bacterium]